MVGVAYVADGTLMLELWRQSCVVRKGTVVSEEEGSLHLVSKSIRDLTSVLKKRGADFANQVNGASAQPGTPPVREQHPPLAGCHGLDLM